MWTEERGPASPLGERDDEIRLLDGDQKVDVAGTRYHQDILSELLRRGGRHGTGQNVLAVLVPEPENQHDPSAVAVLVSGDKVGYLRRPLASGLHKPLVQLGTQTGKPIACRGLILDGSGSAYKDRGEVRVELYFDPKALFTVGVDGNTLEEISSLLADLGAVDQLDDLVQRYADKRAFPGGAFRTIRNQVRVSKGARAVLAEIDYSEAEVDAAFDLAKGKHRAISDARSAGDRNYNRVKSGDDAEIGFSPNELSPGLRVLAVDIFAVQPSGRP